MAVIRVGIQYIPGLSGENHEAKTVTTRVAQKMKLEKRIVDSGRAPRRLFVFKSYSRH